MRGIILSIFFYAGAMVAMVLITTFNWSNVGDIQKIGDHPATSDRLLHSQLEAGSLVNLRGSGELCCESHDLSNLLKPWLS